MKPWKTLNVAGLMILGMTCFACAAEESAAPKVGDAAPDFELKASDGKTYKLSDLKGKAVVIAWFPKAFTGGCTAECKSMKANGEAIRKFDVAYFAASCDTVEEDTKFAKSLEVDYPILADPTCETAKKYALIKGNGKNAARVTYYISPDGKIAAIDREVKTGTHGQDIAAKLKELGVKEKKDAK